ncbi:MAG: hypothetical protein DRG63_10825 [Deltaproteobacteria bacterium]|nr:MAG: hypothetical protein DRG63_10825 [Deltaproteobacteria bacterium]
MRLWVRYFRYAFANISNNRLVHVVSTGTITITLLLFSGFVLFFANIDNWVLEWGQSLSMSVYLKQGVDEKAKRKIKSVLAGIPGAKLERFVSKEQAMEELKETLGSQAGLLDGLNTNPLPASFEVAFGAPERAGIDIEKIKKKLENMPGVDEVQYSEQWLKRFEGLVSMLRIAGLVVGGLLCVAVLFIITNTIRLAIYSRRDEIEIFKLVGATDWFVKVPFLIEGSLQGVLGAVIALGVLFSTYSLLSSKTIQVFGLPLLHLVFLPKGHVIFIISLGLVLGLMASFIAIGRFFKLFYY